MTRILMHNISCMLGVLLLLVTSTAHGERIKDLASIAGVRENQLIGYGLVVGLNGTGDKTNQAPFTSQSVRSMLTQLGVTLPSNANARMKNVAAVIVHASLRAFAKPGQTMDVTVSSFGDAKSLRGGNLLMTPLRGADGQIYAIAQGSLVVGGLGETGADGSKITVNAPSVGRIPGGATVEREVATPFTQGAHVTLNLRRPDFTTTAHMVTAINAAFGQNAASALDGSSVQVRAPRDPASRVAFTSRLENLQIKPGDAPAKVVVNSRTGTVVIGSTVRVSAAAVTHGTLTVTIAEQLDVTQPVGVVTEEQGRMFLLDTGVSLDDLVRALNAVGTAPGDLVAILEALKQAGALQAELVVI